MRDNVRRRLLPHDPLDPFLEAPQPLWTDKAKLQRKRVGPRGPLKQRQFIVRILGQRAQQYVLHNQERWMSGIASWLQYGSVGEPAQKFGGTLNDKNSGEVLHYQAINIDHISDKDPKARRLEFRFFKAQKDLAEIVASIRLVNDITAAANKQMPENNNNNNNNKKKKNKKVQ